MAFITSRNPLVGKHIELTTFDEMGKPKKSDFVAQYKRMKRKALQALQEQLGKSVQPILDDAGQPTGEFPKRPYETDLDMLKDVMGGWVGAQYADGSERPFSHEELEELIEEWPEVVVPLVNGFFEVHREAPRAKN